MQRGRGFTHSRRRPRSSERIAALLRLRLAALLWTAILALAPPAFARNIEVGAYVTGLSDVDARTGSFRIGFFLWFNDPEGRFDLERDLYFVANTVSIGDIDVSRSADGASYTYARVEAVVPVEFDLASFPFDRQRLVLRMESEDPTGIDFVPDRDGTGLSEYLSLRGWSIDGVTLQTEEHVYDTDFGYAAESDTGYSQAILAIEVSRGRSPVLIDDFLGFTFAFLITALTFFLPCSELGLRIGMTTGSLFAAVVNLNRMHDAVGFRPDFAVVDRLAFLVFAALVCALAIAITTNRMSKSDLARANRLDTRLGVALMSTTLILILLTLQTSLN